MGISEAYNEIPETNQSSASLFTKLPILSKERQLSSSTHTNNKLHKSANTATQVWNPGYSSLGGAANR